MSHGADESMGPRGQRLALALAGERVWYALALLGYIAIVLLTKQFSTFAWGVLYFVTVLEVLPRIVRRVRGPGSQRTAPP